MLELGRVLARNDAICLNNSLFSLESLKYYAPES